MNSIPKLIRRCLYILFLSGFLLIIFNIAVLLLIGYKYTSDCSPWKTVAETAEALSKNENGYELSETMVKELNRQKAWAFLINNDTRKIVWHSEALPEEIPLEYSLSDIASFTRGYVMGYPAFTGEYKTGLVVLGFPKKSYWKHMYNGWDYSLIKNAVKYAAVVLGGNIIVIFLIYITINSRMLKSINPILNGIKDLSAEEAVCVKEKGVLSEIAANLNRTSALLQVKNNQLAIKEAARVNWIAGVSHDIRTPLSIVMGYAGQLENDGQLNGEERQKATVIRRQSERIKKLINDLNLVSRLETNMQLVNLDKVNLTAVIRQVIVEFMNMDIEDKHCINWLNSDNPIEFSINGDRELLKRAVTNIIQNSINHNKNGCNIYIDIRKNDNQCRLQIDDDGIGAADELIEKLNNSLQYMSYNENMTGQPHGLGLRIVKEITASHHGRILFGHSSYGGFSVTLFFTGKELGIDL